MDKEMFKKLVLKDFGIEVSSIQMDMLDKYYKLLISWNEKINLTSITDEKDVYLKHFYDSLSVRKEINFNNISSLCDVGTGAGFPGMVIKIFFPHLKVTLIDSLNKRIKFLGILVDELGLDGITLVHGRAEEYGRNNREVFDTVISRAVAPANILYEFCLPLVKVDGYFIMMKGEPIDINETSVNKLGGTFYKKEIFKLPFEESMRTIYIFLKIKKTPLKYPRRYAEIKKKLL